jgi:PilZ domain
VQPSSPPAPPFSVTRKHERFEMLASVQLTAGGETMLLPAGNISQGGVYLAADGHDLSGMTVGARIDVQVFDALDENRAPVRLTAKVVRLDERGMALQWLAVDAQEAAELAKLMDSLQPQNNKK